VVYLPVNVSCPSDGDGDGRFRRQKRFAKKAEAIASSEVN
jgi:hypothetical protein